MPTRDDESVVIPGRGPIAQLETEGLRADGDAVGFDYFDSFRMPSEGFLMRWKDEFVAYENRCPHWSIPMDAVQDEFLDDSKSFILCPMHGAMFDTDTGVCFQGPCEGDYLEKFDVIDIGEDRVEIRNRRPKIKLI